MPTYRVFPLDFNGSISGPVEGFARDNDDDARLLGLTFQAARGHIEFWRGSIKVFPQAKPTGLPQPTAG